MREFYLEKLEYFSNKYGAVLNRISNYISEIDVIQSSVKCALEYGYCKPELVENEVSFFDCKEIRHPILERLPFSGEYVTNDLGLGFENKCGLLLYGVNGSGKSSLSKAVGLNIIMHKVVCMFQVQNLNWLLIIKYLQGLLQMIIYLR